MSDAADDDYIKPEAKDVAGPDAGILSDARAFLQDRITAEQEGRLAALDDLKFVSDAKNQWPAEVAQARRSDGRPCLTINKLPTFLHQVTNDMRQNRGSIKVHPVDDGADVEIADVYQGLIRAIEYESNADVAYDTAGGSAALMGFGFFRLVTEYCGQDSFDQDIKFKRIRNAFTVYLGPHVEPDGSDMMKALITEEIRREEFKRQYPKADPCDESIQRGVGDQLAEWIGKDKVRIAEFYRVETKAAKLIRVNGKAMFADDPAAAGAQPDVNPKTGKPIERMSAVRTVNWYKVTGVEVLERAEIACNWIPVFPVYGDEYDVDGKIIRSGLIRNAKDPAQMYNVWMTAATEEIGLRPKNPFIGAEGQFEGHEPKWNNANTRSYPYMEYVPVTIDGTLAPPPQRQPMADIPAGVLAMAMHASDDIKATTGIYDAGLGARGNETSGRAITARQKESDTSNFHYTDGLARARRHAGRCLVWMIPRVYDTERMVRILGEDEEPKQITVNQPKTPQMKAQEQAKQASKPSKQMAAISEIANDLSVGKYDVTVSTGPSYSTLRQETAEAMIQVSGAYPALWEKAGDLLVKSLDWHNADEIADRIRPPGAEGEDGEVDHAAENQQLKQSVAQLSQALEAAAAHAEQLEAEKKGGTQKALIDKSKAVEVAEINADARRDVAEIGNMGNMLMHGLQPPPQFVAASLEEPNAPQPEAQAPPMPPPQPAAPVQPQAPPAGAF